MEFHYFDILSKAQKGYSRLMDPLCKKYSLTRKELDVMLFLANNPGKDRASDIVNGRGLSKSHVSISVTGLEEKGLLLRQEDEEDRRTVHLRLTDRAAPIVETGRIKQKRFFQYLHNGVTQEQIDAIVAFAELVNKNIQNIEEVIE